MSTSQATFTILLVAGLLAVAIYYAWRQRQALLRLRDSADLTPEDHRFLRNQARRRLLGSALMVLAAGLLAGSFLIEDRAQELADRTEAAHARDKQSILTPDDQVFRRFWVIYWIVLLLSILSILILAAYDFWSTRRYGLRHYRQLQADRQAMLTREIATLRRERNGHP